MCKAMEDMRKEAAAEQLLKTLRNLMKNLGWTAEQAMTAMGGLNQKKVFLLKEFNKSSTGRSKLKIERWSALEIKKWYDLGCGQFLECGDVQGYCLQKRMENCYRKQG